MAPEPDGDELDIAAMAEEAGVSVRTVRYYQQQGLLNAPGVRGPGARYGEADLNRLRLIKLLQREHQPLAEIRRRLEGLDDEGVARALAGLQRPEGSAAAYARSLLASRAVPLQAAARHMAVNYYGARTRTTWERIEVAPDIELHVRRPLSRYESKKLEQAVEHLTRFLNDEETPWT